MAKIKKTQSVPFDPDGNGYDVISARECGLGPDDNGHWPSRCPHTGQILKGRSHSTWNQTVSGEIREGYTIYKGKDGRYYSRKDM